jgi:hypothetical protein
VRQELPLTASMTVYARAHSYSRGVAFQTAVVVLAVAALIPAILSIILLIQRDFLNPATAILWAIFLGLGCVVVLGATHEARLVSRDLAGGVYTRWTGPYTVRMISSRYGSAAQVDVGGRKLSNVAAPPLYAIRQATATVDYLPVSGTLLEVADEAGRVIWSRLPA